MHVIISYAKLIDDKIEFYFTDSLPEGFDPTKIKLDFGGFRPVYSPGTVEYVENTVRWDNFYFIYDYR